MISSLALLVLVSAASGVETSHQKALQTFSQNCSNCHSYPVPKLETDRAWIDAVLETA